MEVSLDEEKEKARRTKMLESFMLDHADRMRKWIDNSPMVRPPILFDEDRDCWIWANREQRRSMMKIIKGATENEKVITNSNPVHSEPLPSAELEPVPITNFDVDEKFAVGLNERGFAEVRKVGEERAVQEIAQPRIVKGEGPLPKKDEAYTRTGGGILIQKSQKGPNDPEANG